MSNLTKQQLYYYENRDKILEQRAKYYEENKEMINERSSKYFKSYYEANKEKIVCKSVNYMKELRKIMTEEERRSYLDRHKEYKKKSDIKMKKLSYQQLMNNNYVLKLPKQPNPQPKPKSNKDQNNTLSFKQNFVIDFDDV